jgi:putative peptide zinc metalloprotease protein
VDWYVISHQLARQQVRVDATTWRMLARLDGLRTVAEAAAPLPQADADDVKQALLQALAQLQAAELLRLDGTSDVNAAVAANRRHRQQRIRARWLRLLSPRLPLIDPDPMLEHSQNWLDWSFRPVALLSWLVFILTAGVTAMIHIDQLAVYGAQRIDDPRSWLLLVILYPLIKVVHELGHGYAAKSAGVAVNEMGITLLVFMPVPFVDATEANALPDKYRRMLVAGAGILVELLLAAIALFSWLQLADGLARDIAYAIMLIGGVSTLLFNGNPLLRFDGYYVLCDAIEMPNLATRSNRYYRYLFRRYLLGVPHLAAPSRASGERRWFVGYGAAALLYRLTISVGIAVFLINTLPLVGAVLAAWLIAVQLVLPLVRLAGYLVSSRELQGRRPSALLRLVAVLAPLVIALVWLPIPQQTVVKGVVMMPDASSVRTGTAGFMAIQHVSDGEEVEAGSVIFTLHNQDIEAEHAELEARHREWHARLDATPFSDRAQREIHAQRLQQIADEQHSLQLRREQLQVRSPKSGQFRSAGRQDLDGVWLPQGEFLGFIDDRRELRVRVVANEPDAVKIRERIDQVSVSVDGADGPVLIAEGMRELPAGTATLPSAALGSRGGGDIQVDSRDERGLRALHRVYGFEATIPYREDAAFIGRRAHVRIAHESKPLLSGLADRARRFVLQQLNI